MNEFKDRVVDVLGVLAISHATFSNLWKLLTGINLNALILAVTSILSIVFLAYRIREARRTSELRKLEIEKKQLELDRMKAEIRNFGKNSNFIKPLKNRQKDE